MKLPNRPARLNRALLFTTGLILLAAGAFELATRFGLIHLVPAHQSLAPLTGHPRHWAPYAAAAAAIVVGLAALRWLAAQALRRPRTQGWRLPASPGHGITTMHADTAAAPLAADVETYEGVRAAAAWLTGPRPSPMLHLRVRTDYDTDLTTLRQQIHHHALPRLRQALELHDLPATILITPASTTTRAR